MDPKHSDTYRQITTRLGMFRPGIDLGKYIKGPDPNLRLNGEKPFIRNQLKQYGVAAANTTLDGITLIPNTRKPNDWMGLLTDLRIARTLAGEQAFAEGKSPSAPAHWALDGSMAQTIGKGFREIWRPKLSDRPLSMNDLPGRRSGGWSAGYGSQFGKDPEPLDISSLHFAVAPDRVNVHIDETGFVFLDADGGLVVGPNAGHHIVNELLWKTLLHLPDWMAERIDIITPNSANDFSRAGVSVDSHRTLLPLLLSPIEFIRRLAVITARVRLHDARVHRKPLALVQSSSSGALP
jgi:hypothetical protein